MHGWLDSPVSPLCSRRRGPLGVGLGRRCCRSRVGPERFCGTFLGGPEDGSRLTGVREGAKRADDAATVV